DQITDFVRGTDKISLSQVDLGGKDFNFIGTSNFHKTVGELRYQVQNGDAYVQGDINGDGAADFTIKVDKITKLTASDFML
ncbi:MAG TPA: M10 family metallopeptidase C-terminal domain-containing protein, partial [Sphingobium sp.]|nr:M10 family metallopeptidase C-terminal domain-containing protein [Sphingobium sp.]